MAYCSRECQMEHRATHKEDCRSGFAAADWAPAWAREGRPPSFVGGDPGCARQQCGMPCRRFMTCALRASSTAHALQQRYNARGSLPQL